MKYFNTYFRVDAGYQWGRGLSEEKTNAFYVEIKKVFTEKGWSIKEHEPYGTIDVIKDKTKLYVHPMDLSGPCEEALIPVVEEMLRSCSSFSFRHTDVFNELADLDAEGLTEKYRERNEANDFLILSSFKTRRKNLGYFISATLFRLGDRIRIETITDYGGRGTGDTTDRYLKERFNELVNQGKISIFPNNPQLARTN